MQVAKLCAAPLSRISVIRSSGPRPLQVQRRSLTAMAASKAVLVPVGTGTEEMEAVITIDVLRRAGAAVTVASVESSKEVTCSRGVKLVADVLIGECSGQAYDLIACPVRGRGVLTHALQPHHTPLTLLLRKQC